MGEELVSDSSTQDKGSGEDNSTPFNYTQVFQGHLPFYLAIGMTWDDYWNGDNTMTKYYREAWELKRKMENQNLWLQGRYVYEAIANLSPILRPFTKGGHALPYPTEPYPITVAEAEEQYARQERANFEANKARMKAMMDMNNIRYKKKVGENG